jgi:exodeoxyribonuclease VII large subunit
MISMDNNLPDHAFTVGELTTYIQDLLVNDPQLRQVWVTGEVSGVPTNHSSGLFFKLQDSHSRALIEAVIWRSQFVNFDDLPEKGQKLLVVGTVRLYPAKGQYQLQVWYSLPLGEGLESLRLQRLSQRLQNEGLFSLERKRPLPVHPQIIAVVTSSQAAAWTDIQKALKNRYPGLKILFSPAIVQGEQAAISIVEAINRVNEDGRAEVLILARGGGATEDLQCFNDERVVRAIANCAIPVITGIGHERDETLADLVADCRASTPTAAATMAVPSLMELYQKHRLRIKYLQQIVQQQLHKAENQLQTLHHRLKSVPLQGELSQKLQLLKQQKMRLIQATKTQLMQKQQDYMSLREKLMILDPKSVLKRGYAVVRQPNGYLVRSTANLISGQQLSIEFGDSQIRVEVIEVLPGSEI